MARLNDNSLVNGNLIWHEGNLDPSAISGDYLPLSGGTLTGDMQINQSTDNPWFTQKAIGSTASSNRFVILLEPIAGNSSNRTAGTFRMFRGSSTNASSATVEVETKSSNDAAEHSVMMDVRDTLQNTNNQFRFVTCTYNGTSYLALDWDTRLGSLSFTDGIFFTGISQSTAAENLTLVEYADATASTIINQEIYDSIAPYTSGSTTERVITADTINLSGRAQTSRVPTASNDIANKAYVDDTAAGGSGGGGGSLHIDNYGADPSGATASDTALDDAVAAADEGTRILLTDGSYRFDDQHIFSKALVLDGTGSEIITTWNDTYTSDLEPCFAFHGTRTGETALSASVSRNDQVISVPDASIYSEGDGILIRENGYLARSYKPTRDVVDSVDTTADTIRLKKGAQYDYDHTHADTYIGRIEPIVRPRFENMTFVSGEGNIPAETRFCRDAIYNNVSVVGYSRHALISWDDLGTKFLNCETSEPTSLDESSGEAFFLVGGTDVLIDKPRIRNARRGIDIRSGTQNVVVNEPNMSDITLHGFSFHNDGTTHVYGSLKVIGGTVSARQTDPDMTAYQTGNGFNTSSNATYQKFIGTTFKFRNRAGDIYGNNVTCRDCHFEPIEDVDDLVEIHTNATNITLEDCHWTNNGRAVSRAIYLRDGAENVHLSGSVEGTFSQAGARYDTVSDVHADLDMSLDGGLYYHYIPIGQTPEDITLRGRAGGPGVTNECLALENGNNIDIDMTVRGSTGTGVRAIRMYDASNVKITGGYYHSLGMAILISGSADGVLIDGVSVDGNSSAAAMGTGLGISGAAPRDLKITNCKMDLGSNDLINITIDTDGFTAVGNTATVSTSAGTNVIWEEGNGVP